MSDFIVGLTGGVASGKSEVTRRFQALGVELYTKYAIEHLQVIERFGRFPHRNRALGRESTPEEQAWLDAGGGF